MPTRWEVERAVWHSKLEPPARLIVLALLAKSNNDTAIVPPEHTPSLTTLEAMTGLSRSTIGEWLNALEDAGWVKRVRPPAGSRTERTSYVLLVGAMSAARRSRDLRKPRMPKATGAPGVPVREADHSTGTPGGPPNDAGMPDFGSAPSELVRPADHSGSAPGGPELVRQADAGSPPGGPAPLCSSPTENYTSQDPSHSSAPADGAKKRSRRVTDDDPDFAAFWTAYPRKVDKGHARTAWASAAKKAEPAAIADAARLFAAQCERNRTEQRFIPHPTTWLNGERWADAPQSAAAASPNGHRAYRNPADMSAYLGDL